MTKKKRFLKLIVLGITIAAAAGILAAFILRRRDEDDFDDFEDFEDFEDTGSAQESDGQVNESVRAEEAGDDFEDWDAESEEDAEDLAGKISEDLAAAVEEAASESGSEA